MRHDLVREGLGYRLRPVTVDDAQFIVSLRTDPELSRHVHATSSSIDDQIAWTMEYFERQGDRYFIVEHSKSSSPEGTVAIYNEDRNESSAEWGRWILRKGSLAAPETAALVYDTGFEDLELETMYTLTERANKPVISFHTSIGSLTVGPVTGPLGERWIKQQMTATRWTQARPVVERQLSAAAALSNR